MHLPINSYILQMGFEHRAVIYPHNLTLTQNKCVSKDREERSKRKMKSEKQNQNQKKWTKLM